MDKTQDNIGEPFMGYLFDHDEHLLCTIDDFQKFVVEEGKYCLNCSIPIDSCDIEPVNGMLLGFYDIDSKFVLYEIKRKFAGEPDHVIDIYAEHAAMCDLTDEVCLTETVTNGSAGYAASKVLNGSRWTIESDESSGTESTTFYYKSKWTCLTQIASKWNCAFRFHWTFDGLSITERKLNVLARIGADRGRRFELWKDIENVGVTYDDTNIVTAVYGRGKGEEVGTNSNGDATYGRRITFADVVWSKSNGDPIDKPAGQEYIENVAATQKWGRCGRPRFMIKIFENITDQEELIMQSYLFMMQNSEPMFDAKLTVTDLEMVFGFEHEAVRNGDGVIVIADEAGIQLSAVVKNISRDYLQGERTVIEMGNYAGSSTDIQSELMEKVDKALDYSELGADVAKKNESLLKGMLDTMKTVIMSSGTNFHTDEYDGSFIWENDTQTRAVRITGSGILIARSKVGTEWQWETALSGEGIVANTITSGVLQANLVKILGSDLFYWDASNIHIIDPENSDNEIRIGEIENNKYGIAFTRDGGLSWQTAISFEGVHFSAGDLGSVQTYLQPDEPNNPSNGDIWFDSDNKNKQYRYNGKDWDAVSDAGFEERLRNAELAITPDAIVSTVTSSETYKTLETNVDNAQAAADNAKSTASKAQTAANSAKTAASKAQTAASNAQSTADSAISSIETLASRVSKAEQKITADSIVSTVASSETYKTLVTNVGNAQTTANSASASVSALETRVSTAEQKITADAIVSTVKSSTAYSDLTKGISDAKTAASNAQSTANSAASTANSAASTANSAQSSVTQLAGEISSKVSAGDIASTINQTAQSVKINASKIEIGAFTYGNADKNGSLPKSLYCGGKLNTTSTTSTGISASNADWAFWAGSGAFRVAQNGYMYASNANIYGTLTAGGWSFGNTGSSYSLNGIGVNMTVLSGWFAGADSSGTRAFYGSSNCDVQYGSDYNYLTYIRANRIKLIVHDGRDVSDFASGYCKRSGSGQFCFVCGESSGSSNTDRNASGNLGYSDQYWDYTFTRVLRAGTYPGSSSRAIKQDIESLPEMGEILDKIEPISFAYKDEPDKQRYGFIYEDMLDILPVVCFDDGMGDPGIVYTDMIAPMLKEIQSLRKRVASLELKGE